MSLTGIETALLGAQYLNVVTVVGHNFRHFWTTHGWAVAAR